jgi:putative FmdB family regulatory protein
MEGCGGNRCYEDAMPLYEYRCESCGSKEEKLEPMSAPERHACPECGKAGAMARQSSVAAFALSGGGVYKTAAKEPSVKEPSAKEPAAKEPAPTPSETPAPAKSGGGCAGDCACH